MSLKHLSSSILIVVCLSLSPLVAQQYKKKNGNYRIHRASKIKIYAQGTRLLSHSQIKVVVKNDSRRVKQKVIKWHNKPTRMYRKFTLRVKKGDLVQISIKNCKYKISAVAIKNKKRKSQTILNNDTVDRRQLKTRRNRNINKKRKTYRVITSQCIQ